jgi:hypothetical protein
MQNESILCFANNICIFSSLDIHGKTSLFYLNIWKPQSHHNAFLFCLQNIRKTWMNSSTLIDTLENQFNEINTIITSCLVKISWFNGMLDISLQTCSIKNRVLSITFNKFELKWKPHNRITANVIFQLTWSIF